MAVDWDSAVLGPCMAAFGETVKPTFSPASGATPFPIDGIFDRAHLEMALADPESPVSELQTVLGVRLAQFASPPLQGDRVSVASVGLTYLVKDVQADGHGGAKLVLMQVGS